MKKIIPFGSRLLVKRQKIGKKLGSGILVASDETAERPTDLAVVVHVPDRSFADLALIQEAEAIITALTNHAKGGDSMALEALIKFNDFLKAKSIKVGDTVMISKYIGTDFHDNVNPGESLTLVLEQDIIGLVITQKETACQTTEK